MTKLSTYMGSLTVFIASLFAVPAGAGAEFADYNSLKKFVNSQGDLVVIDYFQRQHPSTYAILDKKTKTLYVIDAEGKRLQTEKVQTFSGDKLTEGGAGIYVYAGAADAVFYGRAEKDGSIHGLFKGTAQLTQGMPLYVVPETTAHRFRIRNHRITFNASDVIRQRPEYNYSPKNLESRPSKISSDRRGSFVERYVKALQDEKSRLMEIYRLENDEYNMLAELAYGVLSPETEFGTNYLYRFKEMAPYVASIAKGNGFDTDENSRGPTQIKQIPVAIVENYGIQKHELKIPEKAAIATLGKVAELLIEIRTRATQHPGISEETLQNYMYYLYQGRRSAIVNKSATPYFNIKFKQIQAAIKELHIQDMEP